MFEESRSFRALCGGALPTGGPDEVPSAYPRRGETALKAIGWSDLSARLAAARDLRVALRLDAQRHIADAAASFSDAAAKYFRSLEEGEHLVNPGALDGHKGCAPIVQDTASSGTHGRPAAALSVRNDAKDEQ